MSNNQNLPPISSSMLPYTSDIELQMQRLYKSLNEKDRRRYAAIEAAKLVWGEILYIGIL
jgi:hypothetical protein